MIDVGIDVGGKNAHIVILQGGEILTQGKAATGIHKSETAEKLYDETLKKAIDTVDTNIQAKKRDL